MTLAQSSAPQDLRLAAHERHKKLHARWRREAYRPPIKLPTPVACEAPPKPEPMCAPVFDTPRDSLKGSGVTFAAIVYATSAELGIPTPAIYGAHKRDEIVEARSIIGYLAHETERWNEESIGRFLNKDKSTLRHHRKLVRQRISQDKDEVEKLARIRASARRNNVLIPFSKLKKPASIDRIKRIVCSYYMLHPLDIYGKAAGQKYFEIRNIAAYLATLYSGLGSRAIADSFCVGRTSVSKFQDIEARHPAIALLRKEIEATL